MGDQIGIHADPRGPIRPNGAGRSLPDFLVRILQGVDQPEHGSRLFDHPQGLGSDTTEPGIPVFAEHAAHAGTAGAARGPNNFNEAIASERTRSSGSCVAAIKAGKVSSA